MATTSTRLISVLAALLVGALGGWFLRSTVKPHPPFDAEGANAILVGPKAKDVSIPVVTLYKNANDSVVWVATDKKKALFIDFKEEIFDDMTTLPVNQAQGYPYRVDCDHSRCDSGAIKQKSSYPSTPYKYRQTLVDSSGKVDTDDGGIIIKPSH